MSHFSLKKENQLIRILTAVQFAHMVDFVLLMPLGPTLMRVFEINPGQFSVLVSAYTFAAGISGFISSTFLDRFDRRSALIFVVTGFTLGTAACGFSWDYWTLLLGRILAGTFGGLTNTMVFSIIGDVVPYERRGNATGKIMSAFAVGSIAGIPTGLYIAHQYTWNTPFILLAAISVLVILFSMIYLPSMKLHLEGEKEPEKGYHIWKVLNGWSGVRALSLTGVLMMAGFSIIPFVSPYLVRNLGLPEEHITYIFLFGGLATFFTSRLIGYLSDRYGKHKVFVTMSILSVFPIVAITNLHTHYELWMYVATTFFFIFMNGRIVPAMAMVTQTVEGQYRGRFLSLNTTIQHISTGVGALISGQIVQEAFPNGPLKMYPVAGLLSVALALLGAWLGWHLAVQNQKNKFTPEGEQR